MRRGALCTDHVNATDSIDFLRLDWFELAPPPLDEVRDRFGLTLESAAGAVGRWEPGGISPFQERSGPELTDREGREYESCDANSAQS
ncbi:MAG: hypothetical protein ACRDY6_09275 [Acidimicrobiia bacterium]